MSVIQQIQEKYAKLMAVIIAIALIIFVVMLAFENGGNMFAGGNSTTVGTVNGEEIDLMEFQKVVDQHETNLRSRNFGSGAALQQQAIEGAWSQEINRILQESEFDKLGLTVGKKELGDILYGVNAPEDLKKGFTDEAGNYNAQAAKQQIDAILKKTKGTEDEMAQREQLVAFLNYQEMMRATEKYNSLFTNSSNTAKWFIERQNADNSQIASLRLVREAYSSVPDSAVKITDSEIKDYVNKHKKDFKQEESRSIAYVTFSALPTATDSLIARDKIMQLKAEFDTVSNISRFLAMQGVRNFYDGFINGSKIQIPLKDSIFATPVGGVYGPYLDGSTYALAKMLGKRNQPDTVTVRHILVGTSKRDPQTGQFFPIRDTATAFKLADSIRTAIRNGANFDTLAVKLSDDDGKYSQETGAYTGGKYENVTASEMVPEFNDFIFGNPVGAKGIVKTDFGYHYIEILSQKGNSPAYKIAYINRPIEVSSETESNAQNEAAIFAGDSRDQKSFDANAEKLKAKGINKNIATNIFPNAYDIQGLGQSRSFVKKIYEADKGDVLDPEKVGTNYVVAVVTEVFEEGTMDVATARPAVEPLLRNEKKAEILRKKIGNATTLEAVAAALGGKQIETVDSLRMSGGQIHPSATTIASEPKVIGAAFNPDNKGKLSPVIEGASGVFVILVDNVSATSLTNANVAEQRKSRYEQAKQQAMYMGNPLQPLKEAATIKDRRSRFF